MGDNHALVGDLRADFAEPFGDVFVGKAVKSIAAHALGVERFRNREMVNDRAVAAVKRGVEAGDLRQVRETRLDRPDRRKIVRLMQRRQRDITFELGKHPVVD